MAIDKAVDSTQLDNGLTEIAESIRAKTGEDGTMTMAQMPGKISSIQTGIEPGVKTWNIVNPQVQAYLDYLGENPYSADDYSVSYFDAWTPSYNDDPVGIDVNLPAGEMAVADEYNNHAYKNSVSAGTKTIYNLIPHSANYNVSSENKIVATGKLRPTGARRFLRGGGTYDLNMRDLGGLPCDGGTIKFGKLIRGGAVNRTDTETIRILHDEVGIKADLNLLGGMEGFDYTAFSEDVDYCCPTSDGTAWIYYSIEKVDSMRQAFRFIFDSVKRNRPLYFHCQQGADRTGTMAVLIEALLGVPQNICDVDYELTSFSGAEALRKRNGASWTSFIAVINALAGDTFRDKIVNYVASLGFTAKEINDFRNAMIDGNPTQVSPNISTYTVTKTATHVTISGKNTAAQYQRYEAEIAPDPDYKLSDIDVTMGGINIKESCYKQYEYPNSKGEISIPKVNGNIVIAATAIQDAPAYTNLADTLSADWKESTEWSSSGVERAATGKTCTNYIPIAVGDVIRVKGIDFTAASSNSRVSMCGDGGTAVAPQLTSYVYNWSMPAYMTCAYDSAEDCWRFTINSTAYQSMGTFTKIRWYFPDANATDDIIITKNETIE